MLRVFRGVNLLVRFPVVTCVALHTSIRICVTGRFGRRWGKSLGIENMNNNNINSNKPGRIKGVTFQPDVSA